MSVKSNKRRDAIKLALRKEFESVKFARWYSDDGAFGRVVMGNPDLDDEQIVSDFLDKIADKIIAIK